MRNLYSWGEGGRGRDGDGKALRTANQSARSNVLMSFHKQELSVKK